MSAQLLRHAVCLQPTGSLLRTSACTALKEMGVGWIRAAESTSPRLCSEVGRRAFRKLYKAPQSADAPFSLPRKCLRCTYPHPPSAGALGPPLPHRGMPSRAHQCRGRPILVKSHLCGRLWGRSRFLQQVGLDINRILSTASRAVSLIPGMEVAPGARSRRRPVIWRLHGRKHRYGAMRVEQRRQTIALDRQWLRSRR